MQCVHNIFDFYYKKQQQIIYHTAHVYITDLCNSTYVIVNYIIYVIHYSFVLK